MSTVAAAGWRLLALGVVGRFIASDDALRQDSLPYDAETSTGRFSLAGARVPFALQRVGEDE